MSNTALLTGKLLIRLGQLEGSIRVVLRRSLDILKQGELDFVWLAEAGTNFSGLATLRSRRKGYYMM